MFSFMPTCALSFRLCCSRAPQRALDFWRWDGFFSELKFSSVANKGDWHVCLNFQRAYSTLTFALFTGRFLLFKELWSLSVWTVHLFKLSLGLVGYVLGCLVLLSFHACGRVWICCCRQSVWLLLAVCRLPSPMNFCQVMAERACCRLPAGNLWLSLWLTTQTLLGWFLFAPASLH